MTPNRTINVNEAVEVRGIGLGNLLGTVEKTVAYTVSHLLLLTFFC